MAKKKRSAKQKRNDARLGRMAKSRARKSKPKRRRSTTKRRKSKPRKVNKPRKRKRNVAKKRTTSKKKGLFDKIPLVNNPTFKKAAIGVGTATLGSAVLTIIAPSIAANPIVKPALALVGGGIPGVVAQVVTQGGISALGFGGSANGGGNTVNTGFA